MRIIRREDYRRMPWKNGQGMTEEILCFPVGRDSVRFDWRLSIAHVGADGPFSLFPGVDRTIALLEGNGLLLDLPEDRTVTLTGTGDPFSFPGEWPVAGRNLEGPTIDLNVMTRRGHFRHAMTRRTLQTSQSLQAAEYTLLVATAAIRVEIDGRWSQLDRFDTLELERDEQLTVDPVRPVDIFVITVSAATPV